MEIHKRPSQGRGEYEIAGKLAGVAIKDLYGKEIFIDAGHLGIIPSGVHLVSQGGKPRLRKLTKARTAIHLHRQIEAILLLPKSIREEAQLVGGQPIILANRYVLRRIEVASLKKSGTKVIVRFGKIDCINDSGTQEVDYPKRLEEIKLLYELTATLPTEIAGLLAKHYSEIKSANAIAKRIEKVVEQIMDATRAVAPDYDRSIIPGSDPVPFLLELGKIPDIGEPPKMNEIDPSDLEIRRRVADRWRQYRDRGAEGARFRHRVRAAYRYTCVICGLCLPATDELRIPGVDAAHILPWADYDADVVPNGLCLCRLHHWAFDQLLLAIIAEPGGGFRVSVTPLAERVFKGNSGALNDLKRHQGLIPQGRLPLEHDLWPRVAFLKKFYEEIMLDM